MSPIRAPLLPHVDERDDDDAQKAEHLDEAEPPEVAEVNGPRVDEDRLDVEDDEEDRRQVELHRQLQCRPPVLSLPHSKGAFFSRVGLLVAPKAQEASRPPRRWSEETSIEGDHACRKTKLVVRQSRVVIMGILARRGIRRSRSAKAMKTTRVGFLVLARRECQRRGAGARH